MKISEMNYRQKKAFYNVYHAANFLIGGLENTLADFPEDSTEYIEAKATLADHDLLAAQLYDMATTEVHTEGCCSFGKQAESYLKDIRFCGKAWIMERIEKRLRKMGY